MTDSKLRELERRWKETGSVEHEAAYLLERVRVGDLEKEKLELAAYCGHEGAHRALYPAVPSARASHLGRACGVLFRLDLGSQGDSFLQEVFEALTQCVAPKEESIRLRNEASLRFFRTMDELHDVADMDWEALRASGRIREVSREPGALVEEAVGHSGSRNQALLQARIAVLRAVRSAIDYQIGQGTNPFQEAIQESEIALAWFEAAAQSAESFEAHVRAWKLAEQLGLALEGFAAEFPKPVRLIDALLNRQSR